MLLLTSMIVEARPAALLIRLALHNQPCVWIPRYAIRWGEQLVAGEAGLELDVSTAIYKEVMDAIAKASRSKRGMRVLDGQISIWRGEENE